MAYNMLSTEGVNSFVNDWNASQTKKKIDPLEKKKKNWTDLQTAYSDISSKLSSLKGITYSLKQTGTSSAFLEKKASSSNVTFADITATSSAANSSNSIRVNQLAKSDTVISLDQTATADSTTITTPGTHSMIITSGDGNGGVLTSKINVVFESADFTDGKISNKKVQEKIQSELTTNKAIVTSNVVTGSTTSAGSFNIDLGGTITAINYSSGTYSDVIDSIITQVNNINGVNAEKVVDGSNVSIKFTVTNSSKYLSISGDTSGLVSELNLSTSKLIGSSGLVNASVFSPSVGLSQLSVATKQSGDGYKLLSIADSNGGSALSAVGLNLGATRTSFAQNTSGTDVAGYLYNTNQLNAKIEFNGLTVERNSNTISDLITGATINLKSLMQTTDTTVNLSINSNADGIIEKVQDFLKKFNEIYLFLKEKSKSTKDGRGILVSDSTSDTLLSLLTNTSTRSVPGLNTNDINSLTKLGITFAIEEGIKVSDAARLEKSIKEKPELVEAVFNSTNGVAKVLYDRIDPYVNAHGYLHKARNNFDQTITYLDDKIKSTQEKIDKDTSDLRLRYLKISAQTNSLLSNKSIFFMGNGFYR